ncbi:MAG TPA: potassium channel family protein [Candidatus Eremiobacteraceae bacterium]|nr:potassium channel family protein [Candidatus Eremiobacteraceae bacterium]
MDVVYVILGLFGAAWILNDIFKAVLVPRAVSGPNRISVFFARFAFLTMRRLAAIAPPEWREDMLGPLPPLYFILLLGIWLLGLAISYALILWGLRDQVQPALPDFGSAVYFSATSLLTIGYGDFVATSGWTRVISLFAGASGIGTVAVAITFLYSIIGAFQQRERFVVILDTRAGAPASGVALLETYGALGMMHDLSNLFRDSELWAADVLDSHLAYPILMAFRSSHKDESWVAALGALLDAAAVLVTVAVPDDVPIGAARLFLDVGTHLTHDLDAYFDLPGNAPEPTTQAQREIVRTRLNRVGFVIRDDDESWKQFDELRAQYVKPLDGVGRRWLHATAQLIGERTALPGHN